VGNYAADARSLGTDRTKGEKRLGATEWSLVFFILWSGTCFCRASAASSAGEPGGSFAPWAGGRDSVYERVDRPRRVREVASERSTSFCTLRTDGRVGGWVLAGMDARRLRPRMAQALDLRTLLRNAEISGRTAAGTRE